MRYRTVVMLHCILSVSLLSLSCERTHEPSATVRVTGASTVYPIIQLAAEELRRVHNIHVEAQAGGSTRGFEDTLAGRNDLGAMARELTPDEARQVTAYPIAYDGVGVVVHKSNPVSGLRTIDLRRIYRKEVKNWSTFGGLDAQIVVISKAEGHATLTTFLQHTGLNQAELKVDAVGGDNAQVIRLVANEKHAVGFVSMGEVIHSIEAGLPLRLIPLDGIEPTLERVADKAFPMFRTLYLVAKHEPQGKSRILLDYLRSEAGKHIIARGKYVPLS